MKEENNKANFKKIDALLIEQLNNIAKSRSNVLKGSNNIAISTGFKGLDDSFGGWQNSQFVVIGGRPGMGKTAFALTLARNALKESENKVAFFSLETPIKQVLNRLISMESEISLDKIKMTKLLASEWKYLVNNIDNLMDSSLYIEDDFFMSANELMERCCILKKDKNVNLIIIDSLQEIKRDKNQSVDNLIDNLRSLSRELDITIIVTSQLNRRVELRGGAKRPILSDLKNSSIEENADNIILIYRPYYYKITQDEDGLDCREIGEIIIAKNRYGNTDTIKVKFSNKFVLFRELEIIDFDLNSDDPF